MNKKIIGSYVLDTLQIYFPWDDDLYTYFKNRGLGIKGLQKKILPLIYSDNCEVTSGVPENRRKFVISPELFGKTYDQLGWKPTERRTEPIISAEKPEIKVILVNEEVLKFRIFGTVKGKEEYHTEYSITAARGATMNKNWAIPVLSLENFKQLIEDANKVITYNQEDYDNVKIKIERKSKQRELMHFVDIPITSYKFSIGEFLYAKAYFALNGVCNKLPSLKFERKPKYLEKMDPILKIGYVHTNEDQGFQERGPQIALKVSQPKITDSLRGKRCRTKGIIVEEEDYENYFNVPAKKFMAFSQALLKEMRTKQSQLF